MLRLIENPTKVITRMDVPKKFKVASLDNSVYARMTGQPESLKSDEPLPTSIRRLLALFGRKPLRERFKVQLAYSQALYYDRLNDYSQDSLIRTFLPLLIAVKIPEHKDVVMEWPVAKVPGLIARFPKQVSSSIQTQEGQTVERLMFPILKDPDPTTEVGSTFKLPTVGLIQPLCVYEPDEREDNVARAFGFDDFASCPVGRVADVCHAASHLRFARAGDVLLALDKHFLNNREALGTIGIRCLTPEEFLNELDPTKIIRPVKMI